MKPHLRSFLLSSGLLSLLHSLWITFLLPRVSSTFSFTHLQLTNVGIWLLTFLIFSYICRAAEKKASGFVPAFMATSAGKLFGYLIVMLVYCFTHKPYAVTYAMVFLVFYFTYTGLEIFSLVRHFDELKKSQHS